METESKGSAFSLVELSIVLVILGLLTGGILGGQSLIRAAELRSIPSEVARYNTAVLSFRDKYFALPGDISNATEFWGTHSTCPATFAAPMTTMQTCNGNGNGQISNNVAIWSESWAAWQHMANAGLIEGNYSGAPASAADSFFGTAGVNMPQSKGARGAGYVYNFTGTVVSGAGFFDGDYGNSLLWGAGNTIDEGNVLNGGDAWNVDTKMDDGMPATGRVRSYKNSARAECTDSDIAATARYKLNSSANTSSTGGCNLVFVPGF